MSGIRWTEEEYEAWRATKNHNRPTVQTPNVERHTSHAVKAKNEGKEMAPRVRIKFHSKRRRAIDPDGLYSKAVIDGIREGGILIDDSPEFVQSVSYTQEKASQEETIITIELV